ncbi:MAG: ORF6N domain-containing protein [Flavobacteriales bacterium]|nr:ORF6N domain-containing protein [Flavobacteriales bacterium]MBP6697947.1 ORF6N domain-containing protein [Flavobacteriales bacterium]
MAKKPTPKRKFKARELTILPAGAIEGLIFDMRGVKVMVDADLAAIYGTDTRSLKQQVKRNPKRFPSDFKFELGKEEAERLFQTSPRLVPLKFAKVPPMVFTEQGVAMLTSVLNTDRAIAMNIEIMRAFAQYRSFMLDNRELRRELRSLDAKLSRTSKELMDRIDELTAKVLVRDGPKPV